MLVAKKSSRARLISVIAATVISLACGTNYVYSAWGPQFAQRLKLSSTESNLIGTFANLGSYAMGIPFGILIDAKGPRWGIAIGTILFAAGYYPLAKAYDAGPGVFHIAILCMFSTCTGAGSAAAFTAAIKAATLNFPETSGTATAFPLAAYGLSAFAFVTAALAFPHDTGHFLLVLATGTALLPAISFPFLRVPPQTGYEAVPKRESSALRMTHHTAEQRQFHTPDNDDDDDNDVSSLLSASSADLVAEMEAFKASENDRTVDVSDTDIRGFVLLRYVEFWQLFLMLGLLAGIGLMTINNIGNDLHALWRNFDPSVSDAFIAKRQVANVSTLSVCSFIGRLLSGIGSDVLVIRLNRSRFWCLFASAALFAVAQLIATFVEHPDVLILVAGITGLAYGFNFGVFPSLTAHAFGVPGLSQNWGTMTLAPAISGNIFNILYGSIYDGNSIVDENGDRQCLEGRACYSKAYLVTWAASLLALLICSWSIHHENRTKQMKQVMHQRIA